MSNLRARENSRSLTRSVIEDPVPIAFLGFELHGKTSRVTGSVCGTRLPANGGEPEHDRHRLSDIPGLEGMSGGDVGKVLRRRELSVSSGTFGMHNLEEITRPVSKWSILDWHLSVN